jgi:hypothetical protein
MVEVEVVVEVFDLLCLLEEFMYATTKQTTDFNFKRKKWS